MMLPLPLRKYFIYQHRWYSFGRNIGVTANANARSNRSRPVAVATAGVDAVVRPVTSAVRASTHTFPCQATLQLQRQRATSSRWKGIGRWENEHPRNSTWYILQNPILSSRCMSSWRRIDFRDCNSLGGMIETANNNLEVLSARAISAFWTQVPKLLRQGSQRLLDENPHASNHLDSILVHTLEQIDSFRSRDLTQTILGMAKIVKQIGNKETRIPRGNRGNPIQPLQEIFGGDMNSENKRFIFNHIAATSVPDLSEFDSRHLSNFIYAFGLVEHKLDFEDGSTFFDVLADEVVPRLETFDSRDLSNILWAYANAKASDHNLFQKAGETIIRHGLLNSFNSQDISNTVWAYATAEEHHPELFKKVGDHIQQMQSLQEFDGQNLANTVWAYATLDESHPKLFKKVAHHITELNNLGKFNPQNLANTVWAYATANESKPKLFKKVADHITALNNMERFNPQNITNTVWAYATANESHPKLFKKVANHILSLDSLERFTPQALSNIAWAYATANESNSKLFNKVADHITSLDNLERFDPQALSNIVWAYATANEFNPTIFKKVADHIIAQDKLERFNEQGLANFAWSFSVANVAAPSLFNDDFIDACLKKEANFILDHQRQLYQWQLWQDELKTDIRLPPSLESKCYSAFISQVPTPSNLQDDVFSELSSIGLHPEEEKLTERGYRLDAYVEINGEKIGIEVDGPSHFLGRKPTGNTLLKHRQVANLEGIRIVSVPYWEWNKLRKDRQKKQQYLRQLLGLT